MPKWNFWNPVAKFDIDPASLMVIIKHIYNIFLKKNSKHFRISRFKKKAFFAV